MIYFKGKPRISEMKTLMMRKNEIIIFLAAEVYLVVSPQYLNLSLFISGRVSILVRKVVSSMVMILSKSNTMGGTISVVKFSLNS